MAVPLRRGVFVFTTLALRFRCLFSLGSIIRLLRHSGFDWQAVHSFVICEVVPCEESCCAVATFEGPVGTVDPGMAVKVPPSLEGGWTSLAGETPDAKVD